MARAVHFIGFRGDEYISAVRVFGRPTFIHRGWDIRARCDIADDDLVIFATGDADQAPAVYGYEDLREEESARSRGKVQRAAPAKAAGSDEASAKAFSGPPGSVSAPAAAGRADPA